MWLGEGKQLQDGSRGSRVVGIEGKDPGRFTAFQGVLQAKNQGGRRMLLGPSRGVQSRLCNCLDPSCLQSEKLIALEKESLGRGSPP